MTVSVTLLVTVAAAILVYIAVRCLWAINKNKWDNVDRGFCAGIAIIMVGMIYFCCNGIITEKTEATKTAKTKQQFLDSIPVEWNPIFKIIELPMRDTIKLAMVSENLGDSFSTLTVQQAEHMIDKYVCRPCSECKPCWEHVRAFSRIIVKYIDLSIDNIP